MSNRKDMYWFLYKFVCRCTH